MLLLKDMIKNQLEEDLKKVITDLGLEPSDALIYIPKNSGFGEYTTNIALQLSKQKEDKDKQSSIDIAKAIIEKLGKKEYLSKTEVAGGGFINFYLTKEALMSNIHLVCNYSYMVDPQLIDKKEVTQKIFMEYAQPNTHKAFHIGHTRNISLGESLSRLLESQGNSVYRSTYGSDIGLPVAKAIWGVLALEEEFKEVKKKDSRSKAEFLGQAYAKGALAFEEKEEVKAEINKINLNLYARDPKYMSLWEETKKWSLEYFEQVYQKLGTKFDREFLESEVEGEGKRKVLDNIGKIFVEHEGAVIFEGEKYGLHNRVFISSLGNPTYEAKDLGLAFLKRQIWSFDKAIILSGVEQQEYFKVMFCALEMVDESFKGKMVNFPFGMVDLKGKKMSSRTGDVVTFDELFGEVRKKVAEIMQKSGLEDREQIIDMVSIGAIKFSMLKYSPQTKILFDVESSVALDGDSGPYVQYTYARAKSVLRSASYDYQPKIEPGELEPEEKLLLQKIEVFTLIVKEASDSLNPTLLTSFLLEASRAFNMFYQKHPIIKAEEKAEFRLALTCSIAVILKQGLYLLGIDAPERM